MKKINYSIGIFLFLFSTLLPAQSLLTEQASLPCINKKFTIVAHIVRDSLGNADIDEAEILDGMVNLNEAFEPICASFEICEFRYIDNFQYNFMGGNDWDEMQVKYNQNNRINMYFVENSGDSLFCGFATLNGITMLNAGGVVIHKGCILGVKTLPREMGHFFGLLHTFEGNGIELVDGSNCETAGDQICDTPADPFVPGDTEIYVTTNDCRFISLKQDANGAYYVPDVGNIMNYYPGACNCGFTYQQLLRMADNYLAAPGIW